MLVTRSRYRLFAGVVLTLALVAGLARPSSAFLDKTRFAAHLGVAYFCFHHWVLAPYQRGDFVGGAPHRTSSLVKGGAALLFAVHEVKVSEKIARTSKDPLLQKLDGGLTTLMASFAGVGEKLKSGHFSPEDITGLKTDTATVSDGAAADGATIKDVPVALPGS